MTIQLQDSISARGAVDRSQRQQGKGQGDSSFVDQLKEAAQESVDATQDAETESSSGQAIDGEDNRDRADGNRSLSPPQAAKQDVDSLDVRGPDTKSDNVQISAIVQDKASELDGPSNLFVFEKKVAIAVVAGGEVRTAGGAGNQLERLSELPSQRTTDLNAAARSEHLGDGRNLAPSSGSARAQAMDEGGQTGAPLASSSAERLLQSAANDKTGSENIRTLERILGGGQPGLPDAANKAGVRGVAEAVKDGKEIFNSRVADPLKVQATAGLASAMTIEGDRVEKNTPILSAELSDGYGGKAENSRGVHQVAVAARETHVLLPTLGAITGQLGPAIVADLAQVKPSAAPVPNADGAASLPTANSVLRSIKLQLQPAELGLITVKMSLRENVLQLEVQADEVATARTLGQGRDALSSILQGSGYVVDDIVVRGVDGARGVDVPGQSERTGADLSGRGGQADGQRASENNGRSSREQDGRNDRRLSPGSGEVGDDNLPHASDRAVYL